MAKNIIFDKIRKLFTPISEEELRVVFPKPAALAKQVGGDHYKKMAIQPVEFIEANKLGFCEGNAIKYICRWKDKNGIEDLKKARHYIELLIEAESRK